MRRNRSCKRPTTEFEEKLMELSAKIYGLSLDELVGLAERMEIEIEEGSRRLAITRKIVAGIESKIEKLDDKAKGELVDDLARKKVKPVRKSTARR